MLFISLLFISTGAVCGSLQLIVYFLSCAEILASLEHVTKYRHRNLLLLSFFPLSCSKRNQAVISTDFDSNI